jgi:hypothetical protein
MRLSVFGALVIGHDVAIAQGPCKMTHRDGAVLSFGDKDLVAVAIGPGRDPELEPLPAQAVSFLSAH